MSTLAPDYRIMWKLSKIVGSSDAIKVSHRKTEQAIKCICDCKTRSQWNHVVPMKGTYLMLETVNVHIASDDAVTYVLVASDVWNRRCSDMTVQKQWDMDGAYQLHLHKYNFCDLIDLK